MSVSTQLKTEYDVREAITENRLKGIWRLMTGYRLFYFGAITALGLSATARAASALLLAHFVDEVLLGDDAIQLAPLFALMFVGLALFQGGFSFLSGRWAAYTAEGITRRVRNYLYDHVQRLTFTYHDRMQTGELLQRCTSDVDAVRRFYVDQGVGIGRILLLFTINFIGIMTISVPLALVSVIVIPFVIGISLFFFKRISGKYEALQDQEAVLSTRLQENLTGVRVVKAFARQDHEAERFEVDNWKQYELGKAFMVLNAMFWPTSDMLSSTQMLIGYVVGALMVINGDITIGGYLAYVGMVHMIIFPIQNLGRLIVDTSTGLVSFDRVLSIVKEEREYLAEDEAPPVTDLQGAFRFENVSFEYEPNMPVLNNITFECQPGQIVALLGSTGAGKTSLMALLPRFYDYTSGSIKLDGVELRDYPKRFLRENIGVVEQEPFLFSRSIRDNITYGVQREVSDEEVERAARAAAIHEVIVDKFPEKYDTLVGERGVTLSGGQKQRLVLARALLKNPRVLVLDDATSSVDTETEAHIRESLKTLMKDRTSFIIAHRIQSVRHADVILVFDKGRIVQQGTHDELVEQDGIYRRTYLMQSRIDEALEKELANV